MDGGVDAAITRFFGEALPAAVRRRIIEEFEVNSMIRCHVPDNESGILSRPVLPSSLWLISHEGEQPVGTSFIIETGNAKHPFLAHTPTMVQSSRAI